MGAGCGLVHPRVLTAWEQALCGSGPTPRLPCSRALSRSLREQGRAQTVEEGRQNTRGAWMVAAEEARGAEAKGPRRRRRSARLDGDDEGGEAERARRTATRGAVRAEERGEATEGGGRRSRKAVTEKAAAGIEWNGGTACKEKGLSPSPSLLEGLTHTPASLLFLGRALPPL